MSFVIDLLLLCVLVLMVWMYAHRSIFAALSGLLSVVLAAAAATALVGVTAQPLADYVIAPLAEQSAANDLADMFSAPHLSGGRETVANLPLDTLVEGRPDAYHQLLAHWSVDADAVERAYRADQKPATLLVALTADWVTAISRGIALTVLTALLTLLLRLIAQRVEQNFPPQRRYRGIKRLLPGGVGALAGLTVLWVIALVLAWVVPVTAGQVVFLSAHTLEKTDVFRLLYACDPLRWLVGLFT